MIAASPCWIANTCVRENCLMRAFKRLGASIPFRYFWIKPIVTTTILLRCHSFYHASWSLCKPFLQIVGHLGSGDAFQDKWILWHKTPLWDSEKRKSRISYLSIPVGLVGELDLVEGDNVLGPVSPEVGGLGVDVDSLGWGRLSLPSRHPLPIHVLPSVARARDSKSIWPTGKSNQF
jgi:hypothetical protein